MMDGPMFLSKHIAKFTCPCCAQAVPWMQRSRFLRLAGRRRSGQCPNCSAWIVLDKWAHRFLSGGLLGMIGLILLDAGGYSTLFGRELFLGLFAAAIGLIVLGYMKLRFVKGDSTSPCPPKEQPSGSARREPGSE